MRDGRRKRLGLAEGTEGTVENTYLDRILEEAGPDTLTLDPNAFVNTRDNRYVNDAYNYYLGGGTGEVPTATVAPDFTGGEMIDTGGEGQATSGVDLGAGTGNTDFEQNLLDQGAGVRSPDGTIVAPGEYPSTQAEMDAFNQIPVTPQTYADTGRADLLEQAGNIEDIGYATDYQGDQGEVTADDYDTTFDQGEITADNYGTPATDLGEITADDYGTNTFAGNTATLEDAGGTYDGNQSAEGGFGLESEFAPYGRNPNTGEAYQTPRSISDQNAVLGQTFGSVNEVTDDPTMQETISNAFTSARQNIGSLAEAGVDQIQEIGQSIANTIGGVYNGVNQTISVFGKEINVPTTLAGIALNQVVGAPISLAFGALKAIGGMLPQDSQGNINARNITAELVAEGAGGGYNMQSGNIGQDPFGRNPVSAFGDYNATIANDLNSQLTDPLSIAKKEYAEQYIDKKEKKELGQNYDIEGTDEGDRADEETITADEAFADTGDYDVYSGGGADRDPVGPGFGDTDYADPGVDAEENQPSGGDGPAPSAPADDYDFSDFDVGDTSVAADVTGDPISSFFDAVDNAPSGDGKSEQTTDPAENTQGGGYSCFIAGTKVTMSDGTLKNIEDIIVGDKVKGHKNDNEVIKLDPTLLANRKLYSFNNNDHYFFTSEHPFMTEEGWKSVKPEKTKERDGIELYNQLEGELKIGDKLVTDKGLIEITDIKSKEINKPDMPLYNFNVSNDNSYIADGYVVHNKGGGGGKGIVCTMMNDFYGFGSFRNKIWLEHSKSLAPEYQKGYHKIFLPLVAYARKNGVTNKIVRKTLEHIAVHRTIDIRQESRGKTHLLGRVYRKILEPICYLVGKYAK